MYVGEDDMQVWCTCGREAAAGVFLNPWGLSRFITLTLAGIDQKKLPPYCELRPQPRVAMASTHPKRPRNLSYVLLLLALMQLSLGASKINRATLTDNSTDVLWLQAFRHEITSDPFGLFSSWNSSANRSSYLKKLGLQSNMLSKELPPNIGHGLPNLQLLNLGHNMFGGQIPASLGNASGLQILYLEANSFIGPLPSSLGQLTQLTNLSLGNNKFGGPIPPTLGNLKQLSFLDLSQNNLEGNIPIQLGSLSSLAKLDLSSNKLIGKIS